jgi:hypothetical protein
MSANTASNVVDLGSSPLNFENIRDRRKHLMDFEAQKMIRRRET